MRRSRFAAGLALLLSPTALMIMQGITFNKNLPTNHDLFPAGLFLILSSHEGAQDDRAIKRIFAAFGVYMGFYQILHPLMFSCALFPWCVAHDCSEFCAMFCFGKHLHYVLAPLFALWFIPTWVAALGQSGDQLLLRLCFVARATFLFVACNDQLSYGIPRAVDAWRVVHGSFLGFAWTLDPAGKAWPVPLPGDTRMYCAAHSDVTSFVWLLTLYATAHHPLPPAEARAQTRKGLRWLGQDAGTLL